MTAKSFHQESPHLCAIRCMESLGFARDGQQRHFLAFLNSNLEIKFLKKEDPMNESGLGILLHHEVPKRRMIGENYGFGP